MSENNLLLCPFCGGESKVVNNNYCADMQFDDDHDEFYCMCTHCGAKGESYHVRNARYRKNGKEELEEAEQKAIAAWNKRTCSCKKQEG